MNDTEKLHKGLNNFKLQITVNFHLHYLKNTLCPRCLRKKNVLKNDRH